MPELEDTDPSIGPLVAAPDPKITCISLRMPRSMAQLEQASVAEVRRCTCFNLRKAARAVTQLYDETLRPSGLRITQFSLLTVIRAFGRVTITQLAEEAVMDRTTLTRNLNLLERQGLVLIQPGKDGRVREVTLAPAARSTLNAALPLWAKAQAQVIQKLEAGRLDSLLADLSAAIAAAKQ